MGNYEQLKQSVSDVIKTNGNQEITGSILQNVLLTIISSVGANATFAGIATPTTNPGTPDGPVFWLARQGGTYTNFNAIELQDGLSVLMWNGSWSSQQIFSVDGEPTEGSNNPVKSGGVQQELALGAVYDVSAKNPTAGPNNDGQFESLSALLSDANLNTLIPTAVRKGGMSIKFVQSSDNKYAQYRCKSQSFSANPEDWAIADEGVYVENPKFIYVKTDAKDRILWAIKADGSIYYGAGVPPQVINYIQQKIEELSLDEYEDIVAFLNGLEEGDKTLAELLSEKVDKEEDRSLIDKDVADGIHYDENSKFIDIETDNAGRILGGRKSNGKKFENVGFDVPDVSIDGINLKTIKDLQKKMDVGLDNQNRVIHYRDKDGIQHENVGLETKRIMISPTGLEELKEDLKIPSRYSSPAFIQFSDPHCDAGRTTRENGVNNEERMQLLATTISNTIKSEGNIDFVICTGDEGVGNYLYGERVDNITPFKTTVIENISPKTLFLPVVGNHDPYTEEEWYNCFGFPRQYSVELSSCFVIVLDVYNGSIEWSYRPSAPNADSKGFVTGHYMEENHLTGQRNLRFKAVDNVFLENNLKKAKAIGKDVFVALHTTDYGSATDEDYNAAQTSVRNFYSLLDEYGCQLILEGHSHVIYNQKRGEQWRCNPGWFGPINDYNYDTSPWAISVFKQDAGYLKVYNNIIAHNYVDTPRLGNIPASSTPTNLWVDNIGRAEYKYI